MVEQDIIFRYN